jgi:type II secretory pathway component PulC
VVTHAALIAALRQLRVGHTDIVVERHGRPVTIQVERDAPVDLKTITRISATRFDIPAALARTLAEDLELVTRKVKTNPVFEAGAVRGLRLLDVEHDSLCAAIGLQNNDVLLDIEGRSVGSMSLYEAKYHIDEAKQFTIHVERKRKRVAITYVIR